MNPKEQDPLDTLLADQRIGPAVKLAFIVLWRYAGAEPGRIVTTAAWLGAKLGGSPRAAWDWLDALQANDLIRIGERTRRGSIEIYVWHPCPGNREAIPDPQQRLPLGHPNSAAESCGELPDRWPTPPAGDVEARDVLGGFDAETPEHENPRGGFGAQTPDFDSFRGVNSEKSPPKTDDLGGFGAQTPDLSMNSKSTRNSTSQILNEFNEDNEFNEAPRESLAAQARAAMAAAAPRRPTPGHGLRRIETTRRCSDGPAVATIGAAATALAERQMAESDDPAELKFRLMRRIQSAVGDSAAGGSIAEWVAGMTANLIVYGDVPMRDLDHILIDLDAKRAKLTNPAAWFHAQARKLAARHGKRWPNRKAANQIAGGEMP